MEYNFGDSYFVRMLLFCFISGGGWMLLDKIENEKLNRFLETRLGEVIMYIVLVCWCVLVATLIGIFW